MLRLHQCVVVQRRRSHQRTMLIRLVTAMVVVAVVMLAVSDASLSCITMCLRSGLAAPIMMMMMLL